MKLILRADPKEEGSLQLALSQAPSIIRPDPVRAIPHGGMWCPVGFPARPPVPAARSVVCRSLLGPAVLLGGNNDGALGTYQ